MSKFSGPSLGSTLVRTELQVAALSRVDLYTYRMFQWSIRLWLTTLTVLLCCCAAMPCENSPRSTSSNADQCGPRSNSILDPSFRRSFQSAMRSSRAVEPVHVQRAFCKLPPPTDESMHDWLERQQVSEIENAFASLVPPDKASVAGCSTTVCKAKKVFGKSVGLKLLYLQARYKLNGSHLTNKNASAWTNAELESIMHAVQDFPEQINKFEKPLVRYSRGKVTPKIAEVLSKNPNVCIPTTDYLQFFDCFFAFGDEDANRATVFHELSHAIGERNNLEKSPEWLAISKWEKGVDGKPHPGADDCFISLSGMSRPEEDFADAMMAYRYDPAGLMSACPAKYEFLKMRVFAGAEYTSATSCTQ